MLSKHTLAPAVKSAFTGLLLLTLGACESTPIGSVPVTPASGDGLLAARQLMDQAASAAPERASLLYLEAGWAFLEDDDPGAAALAYEVLEPGWLPQEQLAGYHLLSARLSLIQNDVPGAMTALEQIPATELTTTRGLVTRSQLCALNKNFVCALTLLIEAAGDNGRFNDQIWSYLNQTSGFSAQRRLDDSQSTAHGWWLLHQQMLTSFSLADQQRRLQAWLATHPTHPAAVSLPSPLAALSAFEPEPRHAALLLPLSGPLSQAGESVRDGFIAASLLAGADERFRVTIYDTDTQPLPLLYERLLGNNVDLLVGPLQKDLVADLIALNPEIPILALNYLEETESARANVVQFGLAIEDEARAIATRLRADGASRILLLHNYDDWSTRARRTLVDNWPHPITTQALTDLRTVTEALGTAMHVTDSRARKDQLNQIFGFDLEFLPRARADLDAIVALIDNGEANALVPALKFHFADHLPVYASSQVTRRSRASQIGELTGFLVSELPWFLTGDSLYQSLQEPFELDSNPFASLVALGVDAFRIAERFRLTRSGGNLNMLGSTGALTLDEQGRIRRELAWGRISRNGVQAAPGTGR